MIPAPTLETRAGHPDPTVRQRDVLVFVQRYIAVTEELPSLGMIARRFRFSRQRAHVYLRTARDRGWLTR